MLTNVKKSHNHYVQYSNSDITYEDYVRWAAHERQMTIEQILSEITLADASRALRLGKWELKTARTRDEWQIAKASCDDASSKLDSATSNFIGWMSR